MTMQADTSTISNSLINPRIIIQPDWSNNFKMNISSGNVWLEFKSGSDNITSIKQNIHGFCSIEMLSDENVTTYKTSASDNFELMNINRKQKQLRIKVRDTDFSHTFQGPAKTFLTPSKHEIDEVNNELDSLVKVPKPSKSRVQPTHLPIHPYWLDISSGGVGLTALSDGTITIWDIENGQIRRTLNGHIEDVYVSRFFPSDFAVISGGADMRVKIWSLDNDNNHIRDATLTGHRSRINDVLALDQQHVLSASNDGSAILWDINKNNKINKIVQLDNDSINRFSLIESSSVACACSNGLIRLYNLNSKDMTNEIYIGSSISAICFLPESNQLIYGTEQSILGIYDIRQLNGTPIHVWREQRGKITSIIPSRDRTGILVTTTDGSCFECDKEDFKSIMNAVHSHVYDFTGADDSILNAQVYINNNKIYSICRDGLVRVYDN